MAKLNRSPLQVAPEFKIKLNELQKRIMKSQGEKKSFRQITEEIIASPKFRELENDLIKLGNIKMDIKIKLDKRFLE
jgi:hypothetical protein